MSSWLTRFWGLLKKLFQSLAPATKTDTKPDVPEKDKEPPPPGATSAPGVDPAKSPADITSATAKMRADLQAMGVALGGLATVAIGAVGFTRLDDIFPFPSTAPRWILWLTIAAGAAAVVAVTLLVTGFYYAQRRILIGSNLRGLGPVERRRVARVARDMAADQGATSLRALDQRASRLARISREMTAAGKPHLAEAAETEARRLDGVVRLSLLQLSAFVMERRSRYALGGWLPTTLSLVAVLSLGYMLGVADYAKGKRALPQEKVAQVGACLDQVPATLDTTQAGALRDACIASMTASTSTTGTTTTTSTTTTSSTSTATTTTTPATTTTK